MVYLVFLYLYMLYKLYNILIKWNGKFKNINEKKLYDCILCINYCLSKEIETINKISYKKYYN